MGGGLILTMSAAFLFSYDLITQLDLFKAHKIEIRGAYRLSEEEIYNQANINRGMNIFLINLSYARKRLLAHPWIAAAEIRLRPPSGILIQIREHSPLAFIELDKTYIINDQGEIFKEKGKLDRFQLPTIRGLSFSDLYIPDQPQTAPFRAVMEVLSLGKHLDSILPNRTIQEIHVDREIGLTLLAFKNKISIRLGYSNLSEKYDRLKHVLSHLRKRTDYNGIHFIDLNDTKRIVMRPIRAGASGDENKEV